MSQIVITPARKEKRADTVYGQILAEITSGKFTEGDKLPSEAELSMAFDVSRPVVREALLKLSTDGLVPSRRGIGTFVSTKPSTRLTELADAAISTLLKRRHVILPMAIWSKCTTSAAV